MISDRQLEDWELEVQDNHDWGREMTALIAEVRRLRDVEEIALDYKHTLGHVARCDGGTCPYCPEEARKVLRRWESSHERGSPHD